MSQAMTPEIRDLRQQFREFIDGEVIPAEPALYQENPVKGPTFARLKKEAKRRGLWAIGHPKEIGGGGLPFMPFVFLNEIVGRSHWGQICVGTAIDAGLDHARTATPARSRSKRYLEPLVAGDIVPSVGLTEPEVAGSDPTLMRATAALDGDEWVINAHKWFTTGANIAAFTTVFCKTDPDETDKYRQFSSIIVPTDTPGYEIVRVVPTMGHTGGGHCEIRLDRRARAQDQPARPARPRASSSRRSGSARAASSTACAGWDRRSAPSS